MFEQVVVSGLTLGAIYALIAIGFTIVFSTVRVVNFAHGEFVMAGGVLYAWLNVVHGISVGVAIPLAIAGCVVLAWLSYELCLAGMNKDNHIAQVMVTLGLGITIKGLVVGTAAADTQFGFTAQQISSFKSLGFTAPLTSGTDPAISLSSTTGDVTLREI